ncbi:hypothetical protein C4J81_09640 [Deltaproteobacteria bacterium Smac51]|nr:hypothetical protein C4J81_09640 [Deltaproteobacteria bacterium Smac51]
MDGLSRDSYKFLAELRANNNRTWFMENKDRAEELLLAPARELVVEEGELLRKIRPDIIADPRTDRSIYRLNRDTRFSRDKTPYKEHLAVWWWEGGQGRLECPGFYFHFMPDGWGWSIGCYRFSESGLAGWRSALLDKKKGAAFRRIVEEMEKNGINFSQPELKRSPAGFDPAHPMARWLRHKGFYTWNEEPGHPDELFEDGRAEFLFDHFKLGFKLHEWLVRYTQ